MTSKTQANATGLLGLAVGGGFLLLYPLFFVYHFIVGSGFLQPFALGLYGPTTVLVAAVGGLPLALVIRRYAGSPLVAMTAFFLFYCTAWVLLFGYGFPDNPYLDQVNFQSFSVILGWVALFIVGIFFPWRSTNVRLACLGSFALIGLIVAANTSWSAMALTIPGQDTGDVTSYQGFARSVFVLSFALLAWARTKFELAAIWSASTLALFLIGARSEFSAYLATTLIVAIIGSRGKPLRAFFLLFSVISAWALTSGLGASLADALGQSRHVGLLDLAADTSWRGRQAMQEFALGQIANQPVFGIYGGHLYFYNPELGSEAHNALSAWVTFGVLGFCLYVSITAGTLWQSIRFFLAQPQRPDVRFACYMALSVAILIISSKSVYWAEPALAWGAVAALVIRSAPKSGAPALGAPREPRRPKWRGQPERYVR